MVNGGVSNVFNLKELAAIKFALAAFEAHLSGLRVRCNTDNQNVVRIIQFGSMVKESQDIALAIFLFTSRRQIQLAMNWIPRDQNSQADFFSKIVDFDDYSVIDDVFFHLEELWGPHSVDRFACSYNAKLLRFNSRFLQLGAEAVDAFSQDWSSDNNWLVPPTTLIDRVLCHMRDCKALGLFGTKALKSRCLAIRIDFADDSCPSTVGFCTSPKGWCPVCRS